MIREAENERLKKVEENHKRREKTVLNLLAQDYGLNTEIQRLNGVIARMACHMFQEPRVDFLEEDDE